MGFILNNVKNIQQKQDILFFYELKFIIFANSFSFNDDDPTNIAFISSLLTISNILFELILPP